MKNSDIGEKKVKLNMEHQEAIDLVRNVCKDNGFGIIAEFSPSEVLNRTLGVDRKPYHILGVCDAKIANKALDISLKIGGLFPCNMVIWEEEPGVQVVYHVSIMRIARITGMVPDDEEWQEILDITGKNVEAVFEELSKR